MPITLSSAALPTFITTLRNLGHCLDKAVANAAARKFDVEVLVRLFWRGIVVHNLPTRVTYPLDGVSHFDVWRDNVRISRMHARLFFGMLRRLPRLLVRRAAVAS